MEWKDMIVLWMQWCEGLLEDIESRDAALNWNILGGEATQLRRIDPIIHVEIAAYLVGLMAVLDYIAAEIVERYGLKPQPSADADRPKKPKKHKVYFPVECKNPAGFKGKMDSMFPGLLERDPKLYETVRGIQPYQGDQCGHLRKLKELVNENKHLQLTPTTRLREGCEMTSESTYRRFPLRSEPSGPAILSSEHLAFADVELLVLPILRGCRRDVETVLKALAPFGLP